MNFEKYKNDGWGLSLKAFQELYGILRTRPTWHIVEFGSGISTEFLYDYHAEFGGLSIDSFDNDPQRAHPKAVIRPLIECSTEDFNWQIEKMTFDRSLWQIRQDSPHTRQLNCFYDLTPEDLKPRYDLLIVDGPHGNGRSMAYVIMAHKLLPGAYVLIDDHTHYPFTNHFLSIFKATLVHETKSPTDNHQIWKII